MAATKSIMRADPSDERKRVNLWAQYLRSPKNKISLDPRRLETLAQANVQLTFGGTGREAVQGIVLELAC